MTAAVRHATVEAVATLKYGPRAGQPTHAYAVTSAGVRVFVHPSDCQDGIVPPEGARIECVVDDRSDPRGPRARDVVVVGAPPPPIERICIDCDEPFVVSAGQQAWLARKGLHPSHRCPDCRRLRSART